MPEDVVISDNYVMTVDQSKSKLTIVNGEVCGTMSGQIGTGSNAQQAIVYKVIKYVFVVGAILSVLVVINYWLFNLWQRIWCKNSLYKYYATCFSCIF